MNKKEMRSLSKIEEKYFKEMVEGIISNSATVQEFMDKTYPDAWKTDKYSKKVEKAVNALCKLVQCLEEEYESVLIGPVDFDRVTFVLNIIENQLTEIDKVALVKSLAEKYRWAL